jgi:hypothetical protein
MESDKQGGTLVAASWWKLVYPEQPNKKNQVTEKVFELYSKRQ